MRHRIFRDSLCKNKYLHRFNIEAEYETGVLEVCEICKMRKFFKVIMDKIDNQEYMDWHFRLALPPSHPYYAHEHDYNPLSDIVSPFV